MWRCSPTFVDVGLHLRQRLGSTLHLVGDRQAPGLQGVVGRGLRHRVEAPSRAPMPWQTIPRSRDAVTRGSFWRSEPAAALRGLANTGLPASVIDTLSRSKASTGQEHLAAHLDQRGHREVVGAGEPVGHRGDGADVGRDVLAGAPVAAGQGADQPTALVEQVDREAVDLELAQQRRVVDPVARQARVPRRQLVVGERVVEALHPLEVVDGGELGGDGAADLLGRRVGGAQLGELLLEPLELAQRGGRSRRRRASGRRGRSSASGRPRSPRSAHDGAPWPREWPTAVRPCRLSCQAAPTSAVRPDPPIRRTRRTESSAWRRTRRSAPCPVRA